MGDLRGREAGEKCETLIILIQESVTKLLKSRTQNIFDLHLTSSQSPLRLLSKRANETQHEIHNLRIFNSSVKNRKYKASSLRTSSAFRKDA